MESTKDKQHKPLPTFKQQKKKRIKQTLNPTTSHIGIIGAGIGGLSTALALSKAAGFTHITLFEKDDLQRKKRDGYGLTLSYDLNGPLYKLGILEEVANVDCPSRCHYVFDDEGCVLGYYGNAFFGLVGEGGGGGGGGGKRGMGQRGNLRVPRQVLREILIKALFQPTSSSDGENKGEKNAGDTSRKNSTHINEESSASSPVKTETSIKPRIEIKYNKRLTSYIDNINNIPTETTNETNTNSPVTLHFQDGTIEHVDLLIAADGVHSSVTKQMFSSLGEDANYVLKKNKRNQTNEDSSTLLHEEEEKKQELKQAKEKDDGLEYLGVMLILGISNFYHPLLDERGFYTLDGTHRLFTMPFHGCRVDDDDDDSIENENDKDSKSRRRKIMWQLSYKEPNFETTQALKMGGSMELLTEVKKRCKTWHEPVLEMIENTPIETLWGTGLVDRDPTQFLHYSKHINRHGTTSSRVVILGDAVHAMSPFKGQGANQALADGPLLASWLSKSNTSIDVAIKGFMREMIQRTQKKVSSSREAAEFLHSHDVLSSGHDFAGVPKECIPKLLHTLKERNIGAHYGSKLDGAVRDVILDICNTAAATNSIMKKETLVNTSYSIANEEKDSIEQKALTAATNGNTIDIRSLSMRSPLHSEIIRTAVDDKKRSCLHLAALHGHYHVCRWLISEAHVDVDAKVTDIDGRSVLDAAEIGCDERVISLLKKKMSGCK